MPRRIAMPETVKIGPHTAALVISQAAVDAECVESQRRLWGYSDIAALKIYLGAPPKLVGSMLRETVIHECLHFILDGSGVSHSLRQQTVFVEESLVQTLDTPLLALLRDNPALVAWLAAED